MDIIPTTKIIILNLSMLIKKKNDIITVQHTARRK